MIEGIKSLSDTNGAQADYKKLWCELDSLKKGLECIQSLSLDPTQPAQVSAVNSVVNDCLSCVDAFVNRNSKYSALNSTSAKIWSLAGLRNRGLMVQWALWKKADVAKFRTQVQQHADAIQMLLATLQV